MKRKPNAQTPKPKTEIVSDSKPSAKPKTKGIRLDDLIPSEEVKGGHKVIFGSSSKRKR